MKNTEFKSDATTEYQPATVGPTITSLCASNHARLDLTTANIFTTLRVLSLCDSFRHLFPIFHLLAQSFAPLARCRRVVIMVSSCDSSHRFLNTNNSPGGQASYPARTRTPAGQIYRYRARRHYELGVAHEHPSRHVLVRRRPPPAPIVHCTGRERATDEDEGQDDPGMC